MVEASRLKHYCLAGSLALHIGVALAVVVFSLTWRHSVRLDMPAGYEVSLVNLGAPAGPKAKAGPPGPAAVEKPVDKPAPAAEKPAEREPEPTKAEEPKPEPPKPEPPKPEPPKPEPPKPEPPKELPRAEPKADAKAISEKVADKVKPEKPRDPQQAIKDALAAAQKGAKPAEKGGKTALEKELAALQKGSGAKSDGGSLEKELAALQKGGGGGGGTGGGGGGGVGATTLEALYALDVISKVRPHWRFPTSASALGLTAVVQLKLKEDGTIAEYKLVKPSGRQDYDASVLRAIEETKQLSPPPRSIGTDIEINFKLQELAG